MSPRKRGLTEEAAAASIDQACRMLRLPSIRQQFGDLADAAGLYGEWCNSLTESGS